MSPNIYIIVIPSLFLWDNYETNNNLTWKQYQLNWLFWVQRLRIVGITVPTEEWCWTGHPANLVPKPYPITRFLTT